ncbi:alpha/beta hydrolase family protein [Actinoplanes sp. NPDC049265]|uniref:alpha/beta hydrolase family protein n=1 Tax=Actinoplanes sp. NPDC049265 TaxID=3363902 RepID=UPI00371E21F9
MRKILITVLIAAGLTAGGAPASAIAPAPGDIVSRTAASLPAPLQGKGTALRIEYRTTDIKGASITATGLVITPKSNKRNQVVVWAHGTTGLADQCTPSLNQNVFWPEARAAVLELLNRGYTVVAPDYPGLGTPQAHPYLIGESEARSIIDIVKSSRIVDPLLSTKYVIDGHSQGGQGALFAGEIAPGYDGNLVLKGVAAIAPASNLDLIAPDIPDAPGKGYLVMAIYGLSAVDSAVKPDQVLATPAKQKTSVLQTGCLNEILDAYEPLTREQLVPGGTVPNIVITKLAQYGNPAKRPSSAPILIVHGTADEAVPYQITSDVLVPQLQQYSQPVQLITLEGRTHEGAVFDSTTTVANWITQRFAS